MWMWQSHAPAGAASRGGARPAELGTALVSAEVIGEKLDRLAVRGAVGGAVPGIVVARKRLAAGDAGLGDQPLERGEPMMIVGLASVGIAGRLGALDLVGEGRGPLRPGKEATLVQRERHRKRLRLPWLAKDRPVGI